MDASISRAHCFGLLINGAQRGKNMFEGLCSNISQYEIQMQHQDLLKQGGHCGEGHSMGPQGRTCSQHIRRPATDLQPLESLHLQAWCMSWKMDMYISNTAYEEKIAYAKLVQSRPAGHRRAPVWSWWNPRPDLALRGMWGIRDWPFGVIQSMIAAFIPLVLSALAPLAPFWICSNINIMMMNYSQDSHLICNLNHLFLWGCHESILEAGYRSKELAKNSVLLSFAATSQNKLTR